MGKREAVTEYLSDIHEGYGGGFIYTSGFWWELSNQNSLLEGAQPKCCNNT